MRLKNRLQLALFLLVGGAVCPPGLSAVQISPSVQMFTLLHGGEASGEATITNNEEQEISVNPMVTDWHPYPANPGLKAADWLRINGKAFKLKKGESKVVPFHLTAPKSAVGEMMAMLSFDTKKAATGDVTFRVSVAVYLAIQGTEKIEAKVEGLAVQLSSDTTFGYVITNTGNVHIRPSGFMQALDDKGAVVANVVFKDELPVHPGDTKSFYQTMKKFRMPSGSYTAVLSLADSDRNHPFPVFKKKFSIDGEGKVKAE